MYFPKESIWILNKCIEKYLTSLVIKEMQIKTAENTTVYSPEWLKLESLTTAAGVLVRWGAAETVTLLVGGKIGKSNWKTVSYYLLKLNSFPVLGLYITEMHVHIYRIYIYKNIRVHTHTHIYLSGDIYIAASFITWHGPEATPSLRMDKGGILIQ